MTTAVFLVRHAAHSLLDRVLCGRMEGVQLSGAGHRQAQSLAHRFARERITSIQSSPCERAIATAQPIAAGSGIELEIVGELDELDAGAWTGQKFSELARDPRWREWNSARRSARPPGGESMAEVQARVLRHLRRMRRESPRGRIVMVTHAEVIRVAVLYSLGLGFDDFARIRIAPASVITLTLSHSGAKPAVTLPEVAAA